MAGNVVTGEKTVVLALRLTVDEDATTADLTEWLTNAMPFLRGDTGQIQSVDGVGELTADEFFARWEEV